MFNKGTIMWGYITYEQAVINQLCYKFIEQLVLWRKDSKLLHYHIAAGG